ncbi:hypothetical protein JCM6882_001909 [Rhodosporidiobolus microsporus]
MHSRRSFSSTAADPDQQLNDAKGDFADAGRRLSSGFRRGWEVLQTGEGREAMKERTSGGLRKLGREAEDEYHHDKFALQAAMAKRAEEKQGYSRPNVFQSDAPSIQRSLAHRSQSTSAASRNGYGTYGGLGSSHPTAQLFSNGTMAPFKGMAGAAAGRGGAYGSREERESGSGSGQREGGGGGGGGLRREAVYGRGY